LYAAEAAVELLIGHRRWLDRDDFVEVSVETGDGLVSGEPMAWVDWHSAVAALGDGRLACSGSEAQVLRVAASVAEGVPVDLRDAVSGLDEVNLALVAQAVLHAGGRRGVVTGLAGTVAQ
jgi:hypothetical protein